MFSGLLGAGYKRLRLVPVSSYKRLQSVRLEPVSAGYGYKRLRLQTVRVFHGYERFGFPVRFGYEPSWVWRLFWDISSLILGKLSHVFFMDVEVPWSALYYFFSFFVHVATCLKSWISLHWPCKSHALFLCSPTLLSRSSSAHTFPLSLFGAGLPLQVIGCRGATGRAAQGFQFPAFFRGQISDAFLRGSRWPNGSILEVKMKVDFDQNVTKNASETRWRFCVDFWSRVH